jgi:plasmid maintenance system antidote protein VapI
MTMHNPPHPGKFIRETYIEPFDISIRSLAENLGVVIFWA